MSLSLGVLQQVRTMAVESDIIFTQRNCDNYLFQG